MKRLRVTVHVDPDRAPAFFALLANAPEISRARIVDWNLAPDRMGTLLFAIDGDPTRFAEEAPDTTGIESVHLSEPERGRASALVVMRPSETPVFAALQRASTRTSLVVRTPIVYRDGAMQARVVGDSEPLQRALEAAPDAVDVRIDEVGSVRGDLDNPVSALSERQREAVIVADKLGYYERPRGATHEDVAAELGCAPATASAHLQKAEAKFVDAVLDEFGPEA